MDYKKYTDILVLDTNIILNDAENVGFLSESSKNLIVIPEIVLDEVDIKKSGFETINFQARKFARLLSEGDIVDRGKHGYLSYTMMNINHGKNIDVLIISKDLYECESKAVDKHIINDRKIIEIAIDSNLITGRKPIFISLDVMARHRAMSMSLDTENFTLTEEQEYVINSELDVDIPLTDTVPVDYIVEKFCITPYCLILNHDNHQETYFKEGNLYWKIDKDELAKQAVTPINREQYVFSSMIMSDYYDIVASDARAGSGKTAIAFSSAVKLFDKGRGRYDKIIYIRKTILSDSVELGFLPGTLEDKMAGYLVPMYDSVELMVTNKRQKKLTKEEKEDKINEMISKYNIEAKYEGFLRGSTLKNAIVILDELQNSEISSLKTILTRMGENCKIIAIGSTKQIDSKYTNKYNNALTYLIEQSQKDTSINIAAVILKKTVRSKLAEWADEIGN